MKHDASSNKFIATNALRRSLRRRVKMTNTTIKAGNREEEKNVRQKQPQDGEQQ
jgi:hypothetical protein